MLLLHYQLLCYPYYVTPISTLQVLTLRYPFLLLRYQSVTFLSLWIRDSNRRQHTCERIWLWNWSWEKSCNGSETSKNVDSAEQSSFTVELVTVKHNFNVAFSNKALVIPLSRHFSMFQLWSNAPRRCNCQAPLTEAPTCRELSVRSENNDDKRL